MNFSWASILTIIIFIALICATYGYYHNKFLKPKSKLPLSHAHFVPGILTSLGILGTFVGIFLGLWNFDISDAAGGIRGNIDESVNQLLSGLKIAFASSIFGLSFALAFKVQLRNRIEQRSREQETFNSSDIYKILDKMNTNMHSFVEEITKQTLDSLTTKMGEMLKIFIADFGKQFGENFARLDKAVEKLVTWQEQYLDQLEAMNKALKRSIKAIDKSEKSIEKMEASFSKIEASMRSIETFNTTLGEHFGENCKNLNASVENLVKWQGEYLEEMRSMTKLLQTSVSAIDKSEGSIAKMDASISSIEETMRGIPASLLPVKETTEALDRHVKDLRGSLISFAVLGEEASDSVSKIETAISAVQRSLEEVQKIGGETEKASKSISSSVVSLRGEMEVVLSAMARKLGGISETFAENYEPLMRELRRIVEAGKEARDE